MTWTYEEQETKNIFLMISEDLDDGKWIDLLILDVILQQEGWVDFGD